MENNLDEERERKKRAIFKGMSPKRQQKILKKNGYEKWDPFQDPKYPIDLRDQKKERVAMILFNEFISDCGIEEYSNEYAQAIKDICTGLIKGEERYKAMFDFCCWYTKAKGKTLSF
jgi:hypothetical protein